MADQQLDQAKKDFAHAKNEYFGAKEKALHKYEHEQKHGLNEPFGHWRTANAPELAATERQFEEASAKVQAAASATTNGGDPWTVIKKKDYFLLHHSVHGREHMEGVLL